MAAPLLDNIVDGKVLEPCVLRKGFAVRGFTHAWRASDDYVWLIAHRVMKERFGKQASRRKHHSTFQGFYFAGLIARLAHR